MVVRPVQSYLAVRPANPESAFRLYAGYAIALFTKLFTPNRFRAVGLHIPGNAPLTVSVKGTRFRARPHTNDIDLLVPGYESEVASWLRVEPGQVVVDVGAHIGRYALSAAKRGAKVVAIEPDPSNFELLEASVRLNGFLSVTCLRVALSNSRGKGALFLSPPENTGISSLEASWAANFDEGRTRPSVEVDLETLDRALGPLALQRVDWLKIDVEGHELPVLEGGESTLGMTQTLILEVSSGNERACMSFLGRVGLDRRASGEGRPAANWLFVRRT